MSLKVTSWVWEHSPAKGTELLLLLAFADQANDEGELFMLRSTIARKGRVHIDTVDRQVAKMIETGKVERSTRPGRSNVYRVLMTDPPAKCGIPQNAGDPAPDPPATDPTPLPQPAGVPSRSRPPHNHVLTRDSNQPPADDPDTSPAGELLAAFMDGLSDYDKTAGTDLAARLNRRALAGDMARLAHLGWTPLALRRWAEHAGWAGASPGAVVTRVRDLGQPSEPPRSAVPAPQTLCPRHPDQPAGRCPQCEQEALSIPAEVLVDQIAAVRAAARAGRDDDPNAVVHPPGTDLFRAVADDFTFPDGP